MRKTFISKENIAMNYQIKRRTQKEQVVELWLIVQTEEDQKPVYKYRALDMIRWIRAEFGNYFTIACSGKKF